MNPETLATPPPALVADLARLKSYFPFRIIWGYVDADGNVCAFAHPTRRTMNAAIRKGHTVFAAQ